MLSLYRRHRSKCPHADDRISRKCRCAIWATGTIEGKPFRQSLKTRNFERAETLKRKLEDGVTPREKGITIKDATDAFIKDCQARNLNPSTFGKYRRLCQRILSFGGPAQLDEWTVEVVRRFRAGWTLAPRTAGKQLEHLRQVFKFCVENGWLRTNPAKALKVPQVKVNPRIPFTEEEVSQILSRAKDDRELAFLMVLRYTGLRIGDASLLKVSQFTGDRIYLYTTKAGTPVSVVIPDSLCSLLKRIAPRGGYFFVRADSTSMHTCSDLWRRRIKIICKGLGISPAHAHRFRHTLAADLLLNGAGVEDVAAVLGNTPSIVQKHYSQWIAARQNKLDDMVKATWSKPKLKLVK